jgi:histidinol dehydrogenase
MLGVPALLAGCDEVVVCSPPDVNGAIHAAILATAHELGIREVYRVGGAQAIGAMAFGTESIPRVDKIFGPGNAYVTAAKQYVSIDPDGAAIDFAAGPSELLIIADASADPVLLAADLLSQAEHDPSSQVVLVCTNPGTPDRVADLIRARVGDAPRKEIIERSLLNSYIVVASSLEEAVAFSNLYAPEHLQLNISSPQDCVPSIRNAGSVFLGAWSPVTAGDYASGTNHTLPTAGAAIAGSGVSVESFTKTTSFQTLTRSGLSSLSPTLLTLSRAEGLEEHARAVEVRLS